MYSGRPNNFKVNDWVYRLLPVAVTNVSRKLQVHWVGPFQVSKPVNEAQTEISVEGKLVLVHNGHLLKATGDKPPIVALRDVQRFLVEGHRFHNEESQEFVRWQFAPNEVIVQRRTCGARQPPQSAAIGCTSYNASSASSVSESQGVPAVSESDSSLAPSQQQASADLHSMNNRSVDSIEPHLQRRAPLSGNGSWSRPPSPLSEVEQPPGEKSPPPQRSENTRQWVEACSNRRGGGGKVKTKVSKSNAAKQTRKTDTQKVNSQLETLVSNHGQSQPQAAKLPSPMNADRLSPPLPPPTYDVKQTKQHKVANTQSRYHFYWNRSARSVCRERKMSAQQAAKQKKADQHRDLTANDLSNLDEPSSVKKVNVSVQNECFEGEDPTPIPQIVDKVKP